MNEIFVAIVVVLGIASLLVLKHKGDEDEEYAKRYGKSGQDK